MSLRGNHVDIARDQQMPFKLIERRETRFNEVKKIAASVARTLQRFSQRPIKRSGWFGRVALAPFGRFVPEMLE